MLSKSLYLRKFSGSSFLMPGTSRAATVTSNSCTLVPTLMPRTRVGLPSASTSWISSRAGELRLILTLRSSRYLMMGSWRKVCGEPSSIRRTEASVRMAKSMKMVSMQRAEMWSQSRKPSAYAIGSHMRSIEPREPPLLMNHSVKVMSSSSRTMFIPPSKSTSARTIGEVPSASALASLSPTPSCSVSANERRPDTGAPIGNRKSSSPMPPPAFTKVCVCSLRRRWSSNEPVRFMIPKRL
mmetsp:Transcript_28054/g.48735  ORF Transcript_28054/g.48735 Transcript_28054/m.48735 type:complete len:240 (-) Transcript_28054:232-951(-)